ncbi:MAG TPA: Type 1 glutamine amidotransferase-like domain-containing protein [Tepidisphaeraceae bacterium]|jgi:dipeptidase E
MKLYLSSYQLGREPRRLRELVGSSVRAAIIMNATDVLGDERRQEYRPKYIAALGEVGFDAFELDLREFFSGPDRLAAALEGVGLLWVVGGNTFVLRRAMRLSGLDAWLPRQLREGRIVYGGFSAGACIAQPSLRGIHLADDPTALPSGYPPFDTIWDGLGLIDFHIVPHYCSPHPESPQMEAVVEYHKAHGQPYRTLSDGEAIVVDGDDVEVVG